MPLGRRVRGQRDLDVPGLDPWDETGLHEHLGAVADSEHRSARVGGRSHSVQHRVLGRDRSGTHPVFVGEPSWEYEPLEAFPGRERHVPAHDLRLGADRTERVAGLGFAVRARELHDRDPRHTGVPSSSQRATPRRQASASEARSRPITV